MRIHRIALGATALCLSVAPLAGQAWDAPMYLPPYPGEDIGVYLAVPDVGDWVLTGIWRQEGNLNLGVRVGLWSGEGAGGEDDTDILLGGEAYGGLLRGTFPLDMNWVLGVGGTLDDDLTWLRIPVGVSIGKRLGGPNLFVLPYVLPRIAFDVLSADDAETETELNVMADVGVDLLVSDNVKLRFGASFGDEVGEDFFLRPRRLGNAFGVGLAVAFGRRVAVQ